MYVFALFLFGFALGTSMRALLLVIAAILMVPFRAGALIIALLLCLRIRLSALLLLFTILRVPHESSPLA